VHLKYLLRNVQPYSRYHLHGSSSSW
jgi:hypothetical protein